GIAVFILYVSLRRNIFRHVGAIFILIAVIYHGASEIVTAVDPAGNSFRATLGNSFAADLQQWIGLVSAAILLSTCTYVLILGRRNRRNTTATDAGDLGRTLGFFDWRIVALIVTPLYLYSILVQANLTAGSGSTAG